MKPRIPVSIAIASAALTCALLWLAPDDRGRGLRPAPLEPQGPRLALATLDGPAHSSAGTTAAGTQRESVPARPMAGSVASSTVAWPVAPLEPTVEHATVLAGHVRDAQGRSVAGAALRRLEPWGTQGGLPPGSEAVLATTDDEGAFRIEGIAHGPWQVRVTSELHPDAIEHGQVAEFDGDAPELDFVLEDGLQVEGLVLASPDVLESLWICARPLDEPAPCAAGEAPRAARCGSDGRFCVRGLRAGRSYALAGWPDRLASTGQARTESIVVRGGERELVLHDELVPALVVRVVAAAGAKPIEDAELELVTIADPAGGTPASESGIRARTDGAGGARLEGLRHATVVVVARHPNFCARESEPLQLGAGGESELTLELHAGGSVEVAVVDAQGAPAASAWLQHDFLGLLPHGTTISPAARSDRGGRVRFEHLEAGVHRFTLLERAGTVGETSAEVTVREGEKHSVRLTVPTSTL